MSNVAEGVEEASRVVKSLNPEFYAHFLSDAARSRKPSPIRGIAHLESTPGLISLLAGKPNASTFPFTSLSFTARSPSDPSHEVNFDLSKEDLAQGLQYGETAGLAELRDWFTGLQEISHGRKRGEGWRVSVGTGSQDLIYKAVVSLVNPGDAVLVESPVYASIIAIFQGLGCEQIEVETDSQGICSQSLRSTLENWPVSKPKPKVLYTVPYGCNPTGMTATLERRKEVLALAREHSFIILEDDAYYYLYYGSAPRPPSYFALELEEVEVGRVLRFDSLSKILSGGIRVGFASGPEALLAAIDLSTQTSNLQPSSLAQMITLRLLKGWGYQEFLVHTKNVAQFYRAKRDIFERFMNKYLFGLAEWNTPEAGMFVWFKLLSDTASNSDDGDSESLIRTKAFERGVLALPGTVFLPSGRKTGYVRAAFSVVGESDAEEAVKRLRDVVLSARSSDVHTLQVAIS